MAIMGGLLLWVVKALQQFQVAGLSVYVVPRALFVSIIRCFCFDIIYTKVQLVLQDGQVYVVYLVVKARKETEAVWASIELVHISCHWIGMVEWWLQVYASECINI